MEVEGELEAPAGQLDVVAVSGGDCEEEARARSGGDEIGCEEGRRRGHP